MRFSLRTLLLVMALAPAVGYWFGLPTLNARRYAAALAAKNYAAADRLCADPRNPFPGEMKDWPSFSAHAKFEPISWQDVWRGDRRMAIYQQAQMGTFVMSFVGFHAVATRDGIKISREQGNRLGIELPEQ